MPGDRKGKGKVIEQPKMKKRSPEEREWERAHVAADAADRPQRTFRIRDPQEDPQGESDKRQRLDQFWGLLPYTV